MNEYKLEKAFDKAVASSQIHESICYIENSAGDFSWSKGYGGKELDTPLLMASITKLFTTACTIKLLESKQLVLEHKVVKYIDREMLKGIHIYKGIDYSSDMTIADLLFQRSGLPDTFLDGSDPYFKRVIQEDFSFSLEDLLQKAIELRPVFSPGTPKKANYTDINFDLLGYIIECITGMKLHEVYNEYIFKPLNLKSTYLAQQAGDLVPVIYYKDTQLKRESFIRSCGASGGGITTARELMVFLKSFWSGKLFDLAIFEKLAPFNRLQMSFYPICYAGGYMKLDVGYPFLPKKTLLGHSGSTGSFAFYSPQQDLFFVGDVNQAANPALPIRLVMKLAMVAE